jgi:hypothetical protein
MAKPFPRNQWNVAGMVSGDRFTHTARRLWLALRMLALFFFYLAWTRERSAGREAEIRAGEEFNKWWAQQREALKGKGLR